MMVKDIWPGSFYPGGPGNPGNLTNVNGALFFAAKDGTHGVELWKSDGTSAGTVIIKDLVPGSLDSNPQSLTNVNGTLFFTTINAGPPGFWKSDGTAAGTVKIGDFAAYEMKNVNGTLFFTRSTSAEGFELWKSDGTAAGTVLVKDIRPGSSGSDPRDLTNMNGVNDSRDIVQPFKKISKRAWCRQAC